MLVKIYSFDTSLNVRLNTGPDLGWWGPPTPTFSGGSIGGAMGAIAPPYIVDKKKI